MVYDIIPLLFPEYYTPREPPAFKEWLNRSFDYADRLVSISEWTARDLRKHAADLGKKPIVRTITMAHEFVGFQRNQSVAPTPAVEGLVGKEFVLCVGTIEHRKNNLALLKTWRRFLDEKMSGLPLLVFAGKFGKGSAEFQQALADDPQLQLHTHVLHAPTDSDLAWLYRNCLFSVYPSQFEGWGLPVGESAWFGRFCVASRATSIPEVCGDLADYVDPHDQSTIDAAIKRVLNDRDYLLQRERRIEAAHLKSWAEVADNIYEFIVGDLSDSERR